MLEGIAYAMGTSGGGGGAQGAPGMFQSLIPLIIIFAIFYFMLIRPQQKKAKEHKALLEALANMEQLKKITLLRRINDVRLYTINN